MSQQEFVPESQGHQEQGHQSLDNEEMVYQPYNWNKHRTSDMPKYEHPSNYDDSIPPYSYRAQDDIHRKQQEQATSDHQPEQRERSQQSQQYTQRSRAEEQPKSGSRTTWQWNQAQWWARPQQNRSTGRTLLFVVLAVIALPILIKLALFLFFALAIGIGVIMAIILGFLFFFLLLAAIATILFYTVRRSLRRSFGNAPRRR